MTISYIIPHKNRVALFEANLKTLNKQTSTDFELIVVDSSDQQQYLSLERVVNYYRSLGMKIRGVTIDPTRHPLSHKPSEYGGNYNPALAQNIGAKLALGEILCLTSPEVINSNKNVENAQLLFSDGSSRFVLGWIDERPIGALPDLSMGISDTDIKSICVKPGLGAMCRDDVQSRPWLPINYFLGFIKKEDFIRVGGIEEGFMGSVAWEDNFFARCCEANGFPATFNKSISGIHLSHSRGYQMDLNNSNKRLWESMATATHANIGREWGSQEYIVREF
jgi:hypothetical protein